MNIHNTIFKSIFILAILILGTSLMAQPKASAKSKANTTGENCFDSMSNKIYFYVTLSQGQYLNNIMSVQDMNGANIDCEITLYTSELIDGEIEYTYSIILPNPVYEYAIGNQLLLNLTFLWFPNEETGFGEISIDELLMDACN